MIILVDFGGQTAHLISRRVRELGVECIIANPDEALEKIDSGLRRNDRRIDGIIFSGGPASVYEKDAPTIDKKIFELGIPILGICYGQQLMCHLLGGKVRPGNKKEFGPATLSISKSSKLLAGVPVTSTVWMSHGDEVVRLPQGFIHNAKTQTIPHAAISNESKKIYGIQFHPEAVHTEYGTQILENFLKICGLTPKKSETDREFVENIVKDIKDSVGDQKALCALSGGVDSSVAALLVHKAIGKNLTSVYIDSGLMRVGETDALKLVFQKHYQMDVDIVNAKNEFLNAIKGVLDPEQKRKIIGKTFIEVFEKEAKKINAKFLVQMNLILLEPLRNFYKDEVRKIGDILGLPKTITQRQPFPGPGLAVRIIGEVTEEKLDILRKANKIVDEELKNIKLWQAFAVFAGIKTTGVRGDNRAYGETIAIRAIEAQDAMSANFAKLPYELLDKISTRIVNEIPQVNRVVYDITNKPPATMEWE